MYSGMILVILGTSGYQMRPKPCKLPSGTYTIDVISWNLHNGCYIMELTPRKLPHGPYTMEVTSWNIHHGSYLINLGSFMLH